MSHSNENLTEKENSVQSAPSWTWMVLVIIFLILIIVAGMKSCSEKEKTTTPASTTVRDNKPSVPAGCKEVSGVWHCTTPVTVPLRTKVKFDSDANIDISYGGNVVHWDWQQGADLPAVKKNGTDRVFTKPEGAKKEVTLRIYPE